MTSRGGGLFLISCLCFEQDMGARVSKVDVAGFEPAARMVNEKYRSVTNYTTRPEEQTFGSLYDSQTKMAAS